MVKILIAKGGMPLVNAPYEHREYEGETALHMAIASGNVALVQLLLDNGADTSIKTTGDYFRSSGPCYFGETALSFAVSTNQIRMVRLLLNHCGDSESKLAAIQEVCVRANDGRVFFSSLPMTFSVTPTATHRSTLRSFTVSRQRLCKHSLRRGPNS
jgi:ankyrin repeat protein